MYSDSLLIFDLDGVPFGLDAGRVRECVWLPELTPVQESLPWVVGIFSLRGQIVPVVDLHLRFGQRSKNYSLTDQIVVLEFNDQLLGLIVSEVREVIGIQRDAIQPSPQFATIVPASTGLIIGELSVGDSLVTLLDISHLIHSASAIFTDADKLKSSVSYFCPDVSSEIQTLFHKRALALQEKTVGDEGTYLELAVIVLSGECFGIELKSVQEFCEINQITPIPCCPSHILGTINLRGDLLTVLDPRTALNLPAVAECASKAVVTFLGEQTVGVAVDEVHDVIYLHTEELQASPSALREQYGNEILGIAPYADSVMIVLDLPALLSREAWIVDERM